MIAGKKKNNSKDNKIRLSRIFGLIFGLMLVLIGIIVFLAINNNWFSESVAILDSEYSCKADECGFEDLSAEEYDDLIADEKSFVVLVDQAGCKTADKLKAYLTGYMQEKGFKVYRMMFSEMKDSSLHTIVKYYPSVAIVADGKIINHLRADSDEDAELYNEREKFVQWLDRHIDISDF